MVSKLLKIGVVTSNRADFGILLPLLNEINKNANLKLELYVTGAHLEKAYGYTINEILSFGFHVSSKIKLKSKHSTTQDINDNIGFLIPQFSKELNKNKPDILILLGDRFEIFASAIAAYILQIPIAHIHGGEVTSGAFDEGFRHSITKLASLHFATTATYRNRIIQLGEFPKTVFNVGALAVDNINGIKLLSKSELEQKINFELGSLSCLVTYHPVTRENNTSIAQLKNLLTALDKYPTLSIIINKTNNDTDGEKMNEILQEFVNKRTNAILIDSLGMIGFLSTLNQINFIIGNSSAGIIEMPYFKKPTINIGDRQKGRVKSQSIIDCKPTSVAIIKSIEKALSPSFTKNCKFYKPVHGSGNAAKTIINKIVKNMALLHAKKAFYDLPKVELSK